MKKILVCGNFGTGAPTSSGQIIKTKILYESLVDKYGNNVVIRHNTANGIKSLVILFFKIIPYLISCKSIVLLPAHNGVKVILPLFSACNKWFNRKLHYVVIGGWLPDLLEKNVSLRQTISKLSGIYVETSFMKTRLEEMGMNNVLIMPNFKRLPHVDETEISQSLDEPLKLCTFSRVIKEKGIEDAIQAVTNINEAYKQTKFILDIYGSVDNDQELWFNDIKQNFPEYVQYKGNVPFDKSVDTLKGYYALLFPTYYSGEGVAGTLIDAMATGLPVVASDWRYNKEVVKDGKTGLLFETHNIKDLECKIDWLYLHVDEYKRMRQASLQESRKYTPEYALRVLSERL